MKTKDAFIKMKEKRLEALIRGGLLRQKDAYEKLVAFKMTIDKVLRWYKYVRTKLIS